MIFGICGGYQMLGECIEDPYGVEEGGKMRGMELLPTRTVLKKEKTRTQEEVVLPEISGVLSGLSGKKARGYEIHMGDTKGCGDVSEDKLPVVLSQGNVYGSYLHGIFDENGIAGEVIAALAERKGISCDTGEMMDYAVFKETQYNKLADTLREYLDMDHIYSILREARITETP